MNCSLEQIANQINRANKIAIFTHMRPDGDAFGSAFALKTALERLGKDCDAFVEGGVPSNLAFIDGISAVKSYPENQNYDLLICVDCSEVYRLGTLVDEYTKFVRKKVPTVNIDHHVSNPRYADFNFVRDCSANCMNIAKLIEYLGVPFEKKIAEYLLIGLLTDSGNFSHDDVGEEALTLAGKLVQAGANISYYHYHLFKKQPKARAKLFAKTMSNIRYFHDDRFALITITKQAMQETGADHGMTEGFVDFPLNVDTVEVACSLMEMNYRQYKVSLRSKKYADVNKIAGTFGGGGHVRAAGCMLFGDLEEVVDKLSYTVSQYLED